MMSMNLVFHVFSALLAFVLAWFLMRMRNNARFSMELIEGARAGQKQAKIYFDTPYRFLKRFTDIMRISFEHDEICASTTQLVKIDGSALLKLCLENGVTSIKMISPDKKQTTLGFLVNSAGAGPVGEKLAAVFNGKFKIELISTNK